MKLKILFYSIFFLVISTWQAKAQELNCQVQVLAPTISNMNPQLLQNMQSGIRDFLNNTRFTDQSFQPHERIECNVIINITSRESSDEFTATLQIQAGRPVYGTSYSSAIFNFIDKQFTFRYQEFQNLNFVASQYMDNLTSVLGYYTFLILAFDSDSYGLYGGTDYFRKAQQVVEAAQSSEHSGWKSSDGRGNRNRYWLVNQLLEDRFKLYRQAWYQYHRQGMDLMATDVEKGRKAIGESLQKMLEMHKLVPASYAQQVFFDIKQNEITNIFSQAPTSEKYKVLNILREVDVRNISRYEAEIK